MSKQEIAVASDIFLRPLGEIIPFVKDCLQANLVPMLRGSPGIGKSAAIHAVAAELNLLVIDMRFAGFDPTDLNGFPGLDHERGIAKYYPFETFPVEAHGSVMATQLPINPKTNQPYAGWLLFADELTNAPMAVQAASYKFFLDRMVGPFKLHEKVFICAAGNLESDNAAAVEMSTALMSRLVNFWVKEDLSFWLQWAQAGNIRSIITSYLEWRRSNFFTFNPNEPDQPFACPRTWEFVNDLLNVWGGNPLGKAVPIGGCINTIATDFIAFAEMRKSLPKKSDILTNPKTAPVPDASEPGPLYALSGALGDWFEKGNEKEMMTYIVRMDPSFQIVTMRNVIRRIGMQVMGQQDVAKWMQDNAEEFMA